MSECSVRYIMHIIPCGTILFPSCLDVALCIEIVPVLYILPLKLYPLALRIGTVCVTELPALFVLLPLAGFAAPQWMVVAGNILGALLFGFTMISAGLFASSLTESQIISAIISFAIMLFIVLMDYFILLIPVKWFAKGLLSISFTSRYAEFTSGILDLSNVLYFLSVGVIFNFFTVRVLEKRRWS